MSTKDQYQRMINQTEDYIEEHLKDKITLDDVSEYVGMSSYHFHRIFSKYSSETLNEFIIRFKLERAAIFMIYNKGIFITEIAYKYGYSESSSFSRSFKKYFKLSPSEYRKAQDVSSD